MTILTTPSKLHWNYFLALERDMDVMSRYIEFDEANFAVCGSLPPEGALRLRPGKAGSAAPAWEEGAPALIASNSPTVPV